MIHRSRRTRTVSANCVIAWSGRAPEMLAIYAADKIAKVRELGLLSTWRASQRKNQAKLGHYRASLEMLRRAAGYTGLVICLEAELGRLDS